MDARTAPSPGSDAALALGCTCPILDNGHGQGRGDGLFVMMADCPVHAYVPEAACLALDPLGAFDEQVEPDAVGQRA